jgi:DNA-binding transcriptional regulator PaaX
VPSWLLLIYKVPSEPSARRVYVWRKLKRLGALLLHDSVWALPATPRTHEQLQWLAEEIREMPGDALLWEAQTLLTGQEQSIKQQFLAQVEADYRDILAALAQPTPDLAALSQRYQQISAVDYFNSPLGLQLRTTLLERKNEE